MVVPWMQGDPSPHATMTGRRRPGRFWCAGPLEFETRTTPGGYVFFDPIGGQDHTRCVSWTTDEFNEMEDRLYDLFCERLGLPERAVHEAMPHCRECHQRLYGNFELNFGRYQVGVNIPGRVPYALGMAINRILTSWEEHRHRPAPSPPA